MSQSKVERVVLEISLKPFTKVDSESIRAVCREVFRQWTPLVRSAKRCGILMWISDGSEILAWNGELDQPMEWARYIGFANADARPYSGHTTDPRRIAIPYIENPPKITYGNVKEIIETLKQIGSAEFGLDVVVGATFDPGPEFAESEFKFKLHPEIMGRGEEAQIGSTVWMVRAWSTLKADANPYAAFPDGIPEGTSFGTFFGRQSQVFLDALGFDYLWVSNGFGFSHFGWSPLGENFNGESFGRVDAGDVAKRILGFWKDFKAECNYPVEVRGTNFTAGIDLASDCVPTQELYEGGYIVAPPPNYPSGALNYDFGLELAGYMSRIANLPGSDFPFRYYPNDPWFWQNPWWDLYNREPFDIYLPMSVSRITGQGETQTASHVELLTIDTEKGELDERCAIEVTPHIRRALEVRPDGPGPLVWLYPFREYHRLLEEAPDRVDIPYFGDWYVAGAINHGLPLNTVVSTDDFAGAYDGGALKDAILVSPVPFADGAHAESIVRFVEGGGRAILYGPVQHAPERVKELLGLAISGDGWSGDLEFNTTLPDDTYVGWSGTRILRHEALLSGGPIKEMLEQRATSAQILASVRHGGEERPYALVRSVQSGGTIAWVRGSSDFTFAIPKVKDAPRRMRQFPAEQCVRSAMALRQIVAAFGYDLRQECLTPATKRALVSIHRHRNGFYFSGFKADTTVRQSFRFPEGAPVIVQQEGYYDGQSITYQLAKSYHAEVRALIKQDAPRTISCRQMPPFPTGMERRIVITGLVDAEVTVYPPLDRMDTLFLASEPSGTIALNAPLRTLEFERLDHGAVRVKGITGTLDINW